MRQGNSHCKAQSSRWLLLAQYSHQNLHLTLVKQDHSKPLCQWFGELARCLLAQALKVTGCAKQLRSHLMRVPMQGSVVLRELNKSQLQSLLVGAAVFQQKLSCSFHVYQDLAVTHLANDQFAKVVLLHVRITNQHMRVDDIQMLLAERLVCNDDAVMSDKFQHCLSELSRLHLVQIIETGDGEIFIDSNPAPHSHIYYKNKRLLVDDLAAARKSQNKQSIVVRYC